MIATHNHSAQQSSPPLSGHPAEDPVQSAPEKSDMLSTNVQNLATPPQLLPSRLITHSPEAGLNPLVDAAAYLFSIIGKLKHLKSYRQLNKLQIELVQEINTFQESVQRHGYNMEYVIVCRYILCAALDDLIANTPWGSQGQWDAHSLLLAFNQDTQHQDKFFTIMERAIKDPAVYIDLMEFMYICLSMGYKGQYRATEHSQYLLEQITHHLYKHIRAYRGDFSKTLSPASLHKPSITKPARASQTPYLLIMVVTACIIMSIFAGLGYLMDVISNEAYQSISAADNSISQQSQNP